MAHTRQLTRASEIKFLVDVHLAERIQAWARHHLQPDPHGGGPSSDQYETDSLYFDTPAFDVFRRRGSFGRAKYRIRRYGGGDTVFLERKLRRPMMVVKRRTQIAPDELRRLDEPDAADWTGHWFHRRILARGLRPICQVSYVRTARGIETPTGLARLTIDEALHAVAIDRVRFTSSPGVPFLAGRRILELKYRLALPPIFKNLIDEMGLEREVASKYRMGMTALGMVDDARLESAVSEG